jgi:hypothetical protein
VEGRCGAKEKETLASGETWGGGGKGAGRRGLVGWVGPLGPVMDHWSIKLKMTTLLHFLSDYRILIVKRCSKIYRKYDHKIINELKYIILIEIVVTIHNVTH